MVRRTGKGPRKRRRPVYPVRRGIETLELALILPVFLLLGMGAVEFSRGLTVQQVLTNAAREGSRQGVLPNSTSDEVKGKVEEYLSVGNIDPTAAEVAITPASLNGVKAGTAVKVHVQVDYGEVSWVPVPKFLGNAVLTGQCTMRHE